MERVAVHVSAANSKLSDNRLHRADHRLARIPERLERRLALAHALQRPNRVLEYGVHELDH